MAHILTDAQDFSDFMDETDTQQNVRKASNYQDQVVDYFHGKGKDNSKHLPWAKSVGKIGFRPSEVTLWAGFNGSGKSLILGQSTLGFIRQGQKVVIASMEMKPHLTIARMCRQEYGKLPSVDAISQFHGWTDKHLWIYDHQGAVKTQKMLAVLRYCAQVLKADHFIVDSLMRCGMAEDDYTAQKNFVDSLCTIARDSGMHIHLVAHSRKQKDEMSQPNKMDVKGSGTITDLVDSVITVWRNKRKEADKMAMMSDPDCLLICDKQRNGEWEGNIGLFYSPDFMRFDETASF